MERVLLHFTGLLLLLALAACSGEKKPAEQNQGQVTSPVLTEKEPGINETIEVDEMPAITKSVNPEYPEEAKKAGIEGTVILKALVDKEGNIRKVVVADRKGGSAAMEQAAITAVKQWIFKPATIKKQPVQMWVSIPFKFKLAEKK